MSWSGVGEVLHGDAWIRDEVEHPGWVTFGPEADPMTIILSPSAR